ncbi:MAG: hypothetical protein GF344_14460, partial [Chitinivibrionales bacterium]|nr:hypothetical protein [Chitinivibrionales bacterium]
HYSEVIDVGRGQIETQQTLDLKKKFETIAGKDKPGTYLLGFRKMDGSVKRHYVKVMVTDLCLTTVTSKHQTHFAVTSFRTGRPVAGATISFEGIRGKKSKTFGVIEKVVTDNEGWAELAHGRFYDKDESKSLRRVVVKKASDVLVLEPQGKFLPDKYANNHWHGKTRGWLEELLRKHEVEQSDIVRAGFVCSERPVYRPEDTVHIKGYIREIVDGTISVPKGGTAEMSIRSPSEYFTYQVGVNQYGSFSIDFFQEAAVTGKYSISVRYNPEGKNEYGGEVANTTFRVDAYRIPKFEVKLHGDDIVPNDRPFSMKVTASYYAGGRLVDADVRWRINSYPYSRRLKKWSDYIVSSDSRYGGAARTSENTSFDSHTKTDENGASTTTIQPSSTIGANPRKFIVEATVTDVDRQTATDTRSVVALPAFMLGAKLKRYITVGSTISAAIAAIGIDEKAVPDQKVHVALKKMRWNSYLQESDFSKGDPKYITEEEIGIVEERDIVTTEAPTAVAFANMEPGVYILDITSNDKLGRRQTLRVDLFLAGEKAVVWKKAEQKVFETVPDKGSYIAGETAEILLKSPFQNATVLACREEPDGAVVYDRVQISKGHGNYSFTVRKEMIPKIPVSFVLMRPRIANAKRVSKASVIDPGKPKTVANTTWITVKPDANIIDIELDHERTANPGSSLPVTITLKDWKGNPVGGEVALWLVDKAVLSLGEEGSINPLPHFMPSVNSYLSIRDSRNLSVGKLADFENSGGDEKMHEREADQ